MVLDLNFGDFGDRLRIYASPNPLTKKVAQLSPRKVLPINPGVSAMMNLNDARRRYASCFKPKPWIYWSDFLTSAAVSWLALVVSVRSDAYSLTHILALIVGIFATLRAVLFIHELSHLKRGALPFFEFAYNLVLGIPFLAPSLLYTGTHHDHHRQNLFGTKGDPEYAPIASWSRFRIILFIVSVIAAPALLAIRWGILGPLSYLLPPLRFFVVSRASSLVINNEYSRALPQGKERTRFVVQEIAAAIWIWSIALLCSQNLLSTQWITQWSIIAAGTLLVNQIRTLAAHLYINDGHKLTVEEQLQDSINLDGGSILTALAAPIGLRFHALHHFLPNVPYHDLPKLHKELIRDLAPNSPYLKSSRPSILSATVTLFISAGSVKTQNSRSRLA